MQVEAYFHSRRTVPINNDAGERVYQYIWTRDYNVSALSRKDKEVEEDAIMQQKTTHSSNKIATTEVCYRIHNFRKAFTVSIDYYQKDEEANLLEQSEQSLLEHSVLTILVVGFSFPGLVIPILIFTATDGSLMNALYRISWDGISSYCCLPFSATTISMYPHQVTCRGV
jgi:hypothetical protein